MTRDPDDEDEPSSTHRRVEPKRGDDEARGHVIAGRRAIFEALDADSGLERIVVAIEHKGSLRGLVDAARRKGVRVDTRPRQDLDALARGIRHQGVIGYAPTFEYAELETLIEAGEKLIIALDEITDPQNLGAMIRSSVAFGAGGLLIPKHRSANVTAAVVRTSAGATEHAKVVRVTNLARTLSELAESGFEIVGLDAEATDELGALGAPPPAGRVLVIGSEGRGLRRLVRESCTRLVRIRLDGPVASLNASAALAVALYEAKRNG
jgi:23S rRNA (guanosine2251-2'-O)-methyltransferase